MGVPIADPISGLFVAGMIFKASANVGWNCVKELVDHNVGETADKVAELTSPLQSEDGDIRSIHEIRARRMGPYVVVDLHLQVNPLLSVSGAQQAGQLIRSTVMKEVSKI